MDKALQLNVMGIKCDNKSCNYINKNVLVEDYIKWLNKPCPKCGENLLTQEDYDNVRGMIKFIEMMNNFMPKIGKDEKKIAFDIEMDGSGKMDFKTKPSND